MQQPKGIAVVLGVLLGLVVVGVIVGGILLLKNESKTQTPQANANTALQLTCSSDADCVSYCGGDPSYQPVCGVTAIGGVGSCTCRSTTGSLVPTGNTNAATSANGNANVNASTNANTSSTVSTTSWKLYTNAKYGFSFMYPAAWTETDYATSADSPLSGDGVKFADPTGKDGSVTWMQKGYVPYQDGQWDSVTASVTIDGRAATKVTYTPKSDQVWASGVPLPRAAVTVGTNPTTWGSDASIGIVQGTIKSWTIVDTILSTFTFTK